MRITKHGMERLLERDDELTNRRLAKRKATIAFHSGLTIGKLEKDYPKIANYMASKKTGNARVVSVRLYEDRLYIFKGRNKRLITTYKIPQFLEEEMNKLYGRHDQSARTL